MLPLFKKEENECENDFERWIYILKNMSTFERMPFLARNAVFKKLSEIADISALSKDERDKYDESIKRMRDAISLMTTAKNEGREEGREEGKTSIIQNMINRNFSDKDIRAAVKCRQKTIDEVREKNACKIAE